MKPMQTTTAGSETFNGTIVEQQGWKMTAPAPGKPLKDDEQKKLTKDLLFVYNI